MAKFEDAGLETFIASIKGGKLPVDPVIMSDVDPVSKKYLKSETFRHKLENSLKIDEVDAKDYAVIFFADSPAVDNVTREIYENGGVVSAVCHGTKSCVRVECR